MARGHTPKNAHQRMENKGLPGLKN